MGCYKKQKENLVSVRKDEVTGKQVVDVKEKIVEHICKCFKCGKMTKSHPLPDGRFVCHNPCWTSMTPEQKALATPPLPMPMPTQEQLQEAFKKARENEQNEKNLQASVYGELPPLQGRKEGQQGAEAEKKDGGTA